MKATNLFLVGMLCTFLAACSKNDTSNNGIGPDQIEIKAYPDANNKISFYATATKLSIDWGDGKIDEATPNGVEREFVHGYTDQNFKTIKIMTDGLSAFGKQNESGASLHKAVYHELRIGACRDLRNIDCPNQSLTVFDVNRCDSLVYIDCRNNQLTASALNSLFTNLPTRKPTDNAKIEINPNPGFPDCDITILSNKGWWNRFYLNDDLCALCSQNSTHTIGSATFETPQIVTPNGDMMNDYFTIYGDNFYSNDYPNSSITFYDRNNNKVISFTFHTGDWWGWNCYKEDGTVVESGLYSYKLTINGNVFNGTFIVVNGTDDYVNTNLFNNSCAKECVKKLNDLSADPCFR